MASRAAERVAASMGYAPGQLWLCKDKALSNFTDLIEVTAEGWVEYVSLLRGGVHFYSHPLTGDDTLGPDWVFVGYTRES